MALQEQWTQAIWNAIEDDIACYVLIVGEEGEILFNNAVAARWLQIDSEPAHPSSIYTALPRAVAGEWNSYVGEVLTSGQAITIDGLIDGEGLRGTIHPLPSAADQRKAALIVFRPLCTISENGRTHPRRRIARRNDLGILERLTPRELQVLMLIANGLSSNAIARSLHRSRRTIDCHRASIGNKLNLSGRSDVTLIALRAGLIRYDHLMPNASEHRSTPDMSDPLVEVILNGALSTGKRSMRRATRN